jgi:hypothetical protein
LRCPGNEGFRDEARREDRPTVAPDGAAQPHNRIRVGYARVSTRGQDHQTQLDALARAEAVIGGAAVTDGAMLEFALHLRDQELSLREIAARLVITTGKKKGQHPSPATVLRMLRDHDEKAAMPAAAPAAQEEPGETFAGTARSGTWQAWPGAV